MKRPIVWFIAAGLCLTSGLARAQEVRIETSQGDITLTLDPVLAPATVKNFLHYAQGGHFDGTTFYRVVPGFVIQAGSYDANGNARPSHAAIALESGNGLKNVRGAVAMARSEDPASATAEFFIDLADNPELDAKDGARPNTTGYAVFAHVSAGMDVADKIASVPLGGSKGPFPPDATPLIAVKIKKVSVVAAAPPTKP